MSYIDVSKMARSDWLRHIQFGNGRWQVASAGSPAQTWVRAVVHWTCVKHVACSRQNGSTHMPPCQVPNLHRLPTGRCFRVGRHRQEREQMAKHMNSYTNTPMHKCHRDERAVKPASSCRHGCAPSLVKSQSEPSRCRVVVYRFPATRCRIVSPPVCKREGNRRLYERPDQIGRRGTGSDSLSRVCGVVGRRQRGRMWLRCVRVSPFKAVASDAADEASSNTNDDGRAVALP